MYCLVQCAILRHKLYSTNVLTAERCVSRKMQGQLSTVLKYWKIQHYNPNSRTDLAGGGLWQGVHKNRWVLKNKVGPKQANTQECYVHAGWLNYCGVWRLRGYVCIWCLCTLPARVIKTVCLLKNTHWSVHTCTLPVLRTPSLIWLS
jgi:hypothetical protein